MSAADWQKVKEIFNSALEHSPETRPDYLLEACGPDVDLRQRVGELLRSYDSDFMEPSEPASFESDKAEHLPVGDRIGRYHVTRPLGKGGMGEVYLACDPELERDVALKLFSPALASDPVHLDRFIREARAASALNHPNICTIYEVDARHDPPYIAMEYLEGETLAAKIRSGELNRSSAIKFILQVADGLAEAHQAGIVHRDIKPANIIVNTRGVAKLVDFGLAKRLTSDLDDVTQQQLSRPGLIMGTVSYMSPEQARGKALDAGTDIWSLGVVLVEALTGSLPFSGETNGDLIASILRSDPELEKSGTEIDPNIRQIILRCLEKKRDERYQSIDEFAEDLRNASETRSGDAPTAILNVQTASVGRDTRSIPVTNRIAVIATCAIALLGIIGLASWKMGWLGSGGPAIASLAVMPFENESGSTDGEILSDGMTESLIGRLSTIPGVSVKARSSVFRYKGKNVAPSTVGNDLAVQAVLTGRIVRRESQIALYVDLIDAKTENVLWKAEYDRPVSNLVTVQSEVVRDVISNLRLKLAGADLANATRNYTENSEAYQHYLKGRFYWDKRNEESYKIAEDAYGRAIELDPNYALAYAGLADCFLFREASLGRDVAIPKAKEFAMKALELDESLAEAHSTLAFVNANYDLDFPSGEREFRRALELNPNYAVAHQFYGSLLVALRRYDEAINEMQRAVDLEPYSAAINWSLGMGLGFAHRNEESIAQFQKTLQLQPNFALAESGLAGMYLLGGRYDEANVLIQKHLAVRERRENAMSFLAILLAKTGREPDARRTLETLISENKSQNNPYNVARVYAALGDREKAIDWLTTAVERRSFSAWFIRVDPFFETLNGDTRFEALVSKIGLNA